MESSKKNKQPLVAIGIPVYNGEKYLFEVLESIRDQKYENLECHIINNSSTDKTRSIVEDFINETKDSRFNLHNYEEFTDLVSNWNRVLNHVPLEAKYLKVVQADDVIFFGAITTMVELMEKYPSAGIGSAYRMVGNRIQGSGIDYFQGNCQNGKEVLLKHLTAKAEITGSITQLFFRMSKLKELPSYPVIFDPLEYHIDSRLAYEMFNISDLVFAFEPLTYSRRHENAETSTTVMKFKTLLHGKESRLHRFRKQYPEVEEYYKISRRRYAYFILKSRLRNNRACLKWHKKFLQRPFTLAEYMSGLIKENRIGAKLFK